MIKITEDNILVADIPRSDAVVNCQYRGGKDSCTCSYYAGDDDQSKMRVKQFMTGCEKMYIEIDSVHEAIKQLDVILDSYIHLFKGDLSDYRKARSYFLVRHENIEIDKFFTTGERGYYTFNNRDDTIIAFKGLLFTKITNFEIRKNDTVYYIRIKISDNWRNEIMKVKMSKEDLISTFNSFMDTAKNKGKVERTAAVVFGVKYNNVIRNSNVTVEELVFESKYTAEELVKAIKLGRTLSPDIIWESQTEEVVVDGFVLDEISNDISYNDLVAELKAMYAETQDNGIRYFGIKYAAYINANNVNCNQLIRDAGINDSYATELRKGVRLAGKVVPKEQLKPAKIACKEDEKHGFDILDRNVYGMHIKLKNNALSSENPHVCIGWGKMGDLTSIEDKDSLSDLHEECFPDKTKKGRVQDVSQIWTFIKTMSIGDYLVYGDGSRAHIGKIVSDYYYDDTNGDQDEDYVNNRKVEWLKSFGYSELPKVFKNSLCSARSVFSLNAYKSLILELLEKGVVDIDDDIEEEQEDINEYSKEDFLKDIFMTEEEYDSLYHLLKYKKNVLLQGAPGVGKTYLAKKLAYSIIGRTNKSQVEMIQFHQNYSYEDFIMGYKPNDNGFELKEGVFYKFCKKAEEDPGKDFFFIIDEINRGNLSKIFGELMMLLEGDKRGEKIKLAYKDEEFSVPENVYLLGMMNTADRSLAMMDYALRRRFSFFDIEPAFAKPAFKEHLRTYIHDGLIIDKVINRLTDLNTKIADENNSGLGKGFCIGHSYFCVEPVEGQTEKDWYTTIIQYEICPLLDEYWWDDKAKADDCKKELLKD